MESPLTARTWSTRKKPDKYGSAVGVGENIIEASWQALVDGLEYGVNGGRKG